MERLRQIAFISILTLLVVAWAGVAVAESSVDERTVTIPMRDGIELEAVLAIGDDGAERRPTILVRTPYGKHQHLDEARFWAANGYAVVVQDARGKFGSGDVFVSFLNEHSDGMDTIDWIVAQPWSDGSVGMWGSSYLAFCQLVLASAGHPALRSIVPISGWIQDDDTINHGGANHIMLSIPWIYHEESQTKRSLANVDLDELFEFLPLIDVFSSIGIESRIWTEEFDFSPLDAYSARDIDIPALHITGWNDFVCRSALATYAQALEGPAGAAQKLMVGPWVHDQFWTTYTEAGDEDFGPSSAMGRERLMQLSLEWFDATLKPGATGVAEWPDARVFVMNANEWHDYDQWPPAGVSQREFFIASDQGANSSGGDGTLGHRSVAMHGTDTYRFDPMNPVPTYGGANFHFFPHLVGVKDQRDIEARDDVLVYTSAPFEETLHIAGPMEAVLFVSTEGRDTDFTAKLVEVRSDGYARIIEEGIVRLACLKGDGERHLIEPGEVYEVRINMGSTAIAIPAGHSLRLEVSSSNFPRYDRNPNTGEDPLMAKELKSVVQTVHFGAQTPSRVIVSVVDAPIMLASNQGGQGDGAVVPASEPAGADALFQRGRKLQDEEKLDEAIDAFREAVAMDEENADYHAGLGEAYIAKLQTVSFFEKGPLANRALGSLQKAVELDPANINARESLVSYYLNAPSIAGGSKKKARHHAEAAAKHDRVRGPALLAQVLIQEEEYGPAAEALKTCVAADPDNTSYRYRLAMLYQKTGEYDRSFATFERILEIEPDAPAALYQIGRTAVFSGTNVERGVECLKRYMQYDIKPGYPGYDAVHWRMGMLFEIQGDRKRARTEYETALQLNPDEDKYRDALKQLD